MAAEQQINSLIEKLSSGDSIERQAAANRLGNLGVRSERIIAALRSAEAKDDDATVREEARSALIVLDYVPGLLPGTPPLSKTIDFVFGFFGWFFIYGIVWLMNIKANPYSGQFGIEAILFPLAIGLPIFLTTRRKYIAWGIASALALNLFISLFLGMFLNGVCAIPFFVSPRTE